MCGLIIVIRQSDDDDNNNKSLFISVASLILALWLAWPAALVYLRSTFETSFHQFSP